MNSSTTNNEAEYDHFKNVIEKVLGSNNEQDNYTITYQRPDKQGQS